jgi:hypothetical protein
MIIGIVGYIGSGKDTVAQRIQHHGGVRDSFAAPLKDCVSAIFGWPRHLLEGDTVESREFRETPDMFWSRKTGIPHFTPRLALQLMGTDVMRDHFHPDIWLDSLEYRIRAQHRDAEVTVISDARFRNELDLIKHMGGTVVWVQRGDLSEWYEVAASANAGSVISAKIMNTKYRDVHQSEWNWAGYKVDHIIDNNGDLQHLHTQVDQVMNQIAQPKLKAI